jgi:hypothetical protein
MPKMAERNDATGAANFVLYWVKVSNYAALTGDTQLLRDISAPNCSGCNRYIELYEKTYEAGGYFKGSNWHLGAPQVEHAGGRFQVFSHVTAPAGTYKSSRGKPAQKAARENSNMVFEVGQTEGQRTLTQLVLRSEWSD